VKIARGHIVIAAVVVLGTAAVVFARRPKPLIVDTSVVTRTRLETTVDADGKTRVRERYVVVAPVAGRVERIALLEGAPVRAGQIVARLTPLPLDSQALAQAQARVDATAALALEAAGQVRVAEAELDQERRALSRAHRLAEAGGVAPRVVEEAELSALQAEQAVRAARRRADAADADVRQARAVFIGQKGHSPATILVRAPATGRVLHVPERSERIVVAGAILVEVGDPASLELVIDVLSSDGATVHAGDRVRLGEWGTQAITERDAASWGTVREVEPSAFTKMSALGVEEQRVNVIADPDAVPPDVGDGFRVEASIIVWSSSDAPVVPRSALLQVNNGQADGWVAFVVRSGRAERRAVRIGHLGGTGAEVLGGIAPGDVVVIFPSDQVVHGARVQPRRS